MITEYNPNAKWDIHEVEVTLMAWDYAGKFTTEIRGNTLAMSILESAPYSLYEDLPENEDGNKHFTLSRPDGETLNCIENETGTDGESWLESYIVGLQIVSRKPYERQ